MLTALERWKEKTKRLKTEVYALYLAYRDPRVPWYAKAFADLIVAYALSPIDLIPDFIPVLGYLDDLVLIPLGVYVAIKLIPGDVMEDCRRRSIEILSSKNPVSRIGALMVVGLWLLLFSLALLITIKIIA